MRFVSTSALRGGALPAFGGAHRTHKRDYAEERGDWFIVLGSRRIVVSTASTKFFLSVHCMGVAQVV